MQNTINEMAQYIKDIIPSNIPKTYTIKSMFKDISEEENVRSGVLAFSDLLYLICNQLIANGSSYEKTSKNTKEDTTHSSLPKSYPFLDNVKSILFNIGYHGELVENSRSLSLDNLQSLTFAIGVDGRQMKAKISVPKIIEVLRFLTCCGICFDGIDLEAEKANLSEVKLLEVSYPDNPVMLIGLKVMAIAQKELYTKGKHDIFLRCDYRVLKDEDTDVTSILRDYFVNPLSDRVQDFSLKLHQRYLDAGLTCIEDVFYLGIRYIYSYKNKEVWTFSASIDSGYRILIKANNTHKYIDVIEKFPLSLQKKIAKGYGCNKKKFCEPCQKGCHGFSFSLDDSILDIGLYIELWIDKELSCL